MVISWQERFKKASSITSNKPSPFGADANPSGLPEVSKSSSIGMGWAALGVMGAIWLGYEIGVKKLVSIR
jgi:hypothetical protein